MLITPSLSFASCCVDVDGDGYSDHKSCRSGTDCDDDNKFIYPGTLGCNNCKDVDDDGYFAHDLLDCSLGDDLDDADPEANPGKDDGGGNGGGGCSSVVWYKDVDDDKYSDGTTLTQCDQPPGYKPASDLNQISGDCADNDHDRNPGEEEVCDGKDNNCDNGGNSDKVDEGCCEIDVLTVNPMSVYPQNTYGYEYTEAIVSLSLIKPAPSDGCAINFGVYPEDSSGGHLHGGNRPKGIMTPNNLTVGYGETVPETVTYKSSVVSGKEWVNAHVEESGSSEWGVVDIRVPGLTGLWGSWYSFYNDKCDIQNCSGYKHEDFYNVLPWVKGRFDNIAYLYHEKFPTAAWLVVTDGSLKAGGLYDFRNTWNSPHTYHRSGTDIDVRSWNIPKGNRADFQRIACDSLGYPDLEFPGKDNEHYHLYFFPYTTKAGNLCDK